MEKLICKICKESFESYYKLSRHLSKHKIKTKEYYDLYLKKEKEGVCTVCGKEPQFHGLKIGYSKRCSLKCLHNDEDVQKQKKNSYLKHYGTDHPLKCKEIQEKIQKTCLEKYNVTNPNQTQEVKEKKKKTYLKNWGVEHSMKCDKGKQKGKETLKERYNVENFGNTPEAKEKKKETSLKNWNTESPNQSVLIKEKKKKTYLKNWGVDNPSQNVLIKDRKRETLLKNYGTTNTYDINHPHTKKYKTTDIYYQGTYELFFLEKIEECNLLEKIKRGPTIKYFYEGEYHLYYPDFILDNTIIEIKSDWTYNKIGKDLKLEEINKHKWESTRQQNYELVVLFSKKEIENYCLTLKK